MLGLTKCPGFVTAGLSTILLDAITDKDPLVQEQVCGALCALGESRPEEVLLACAEHLRQHEKVLLRFRGRGCGTCGRGWGCGTCGRRGLWSGAALAGKSQLQVRAPSSQARPAIDDPLCLVVCGLVSSWGHLGGRHCSVQLLAREAQGRPPLALPRAHLLETRWLSLAARSCVTGAGARPAWAVRSGPGPPRGPSAAASSAARIWPWFY